MPRLSVYLLHSVGPKRHLHVLYTQLSSAHNYLLDSQECNEGGGGGGGEEEEELE